MGEDHPQVGPDFNPWFADAAGFLAKVAADPGLWLRPGGSQFKYLTLRVDTRENVFSLHDRHGEAVNPTDVLAVLPGDRP